MEVRLNKFLAERLGLSRREADEAIEKGQVTVNGEVATLGARVWLDGQAEGNFSAKGDSSAKDQNQTGLIEKNSAFAPKALDKNPKVCYNGIIVPLEAKLLYVAFHKPVGYVCSRRAQGSAPTLYELLPAKYRSLKTVGRLDKDSSGLILLTNDGDFAFQMTHPRFSKRKIYEVVLNRDLEPLHQQMIADFGVKLDDGVSQFLVTRDDAFSDRRHFIVVLTEGRNRQIRRTFGALGYGVTGLHRTNFGKYALQSLKPGEYQEIKP